MTSASGKVPAWDGHDLADLLAFDETGPRTFRTRLGDANEHGSAYGGQVLAQALMAAARTVPGSSRERAPTVLQMLFLQSALPDEAIELEVQPLQDGKRFSSRHVSGVQAGGRAVLDAQATFAVALASPEHAVAAPFPAGEDPDRLPTADQLPTEWAERIYRAIHYPFVPKPPIDLRIAEAPNGMLLERARPRIRFWIRLAHALPDDNALHAAAFAYLSDWWLNFTSPAPHMDDLAGGALFVASLNHAIWLHRPLRADAWLHFETVSASAAHGRGINHALVHDRAGRLVATAMQECLMVPRQAPR